MIASDATTPTAPLVRMARITKRFGRVTVLENVDLDILSGEVHILAGENGAGKSTLIKILAGVHTDFSGTVTIDGRAVRMSGPSDAARHRVAVIYQELSLVPSMSVADNIFLGRTPTMVGGFVRHRQQLQRAAHWLRSFGLSIPPDRPVGQLPVAEQQLVEIVKALSQDARVVVMDEPTSALNAPEVDTLFRIIQQLKQQGVGIVYITHRMEEIERIGDRVTVLRDGRRIGSELRSQLPTTRLLEWMIGRQVEQRYERHQRYCGHPVLQLARFGVTYQRRSAITNVDLIVHAGEIVGLAGLQGSGNSQLLLGLFGAFGRATSGTVRIAGTPYRPISPRTGIRRGMALLTNDRKATGLVLPLSIINNTTLATLNKFTRGGWMRNAQQHQATYDLAQSLHLRAASLDMPVGDLSGGNQQKVALAKWVLSQPRVLLLDEPTRGVDIGAKQEIYELMQAWAASGIGILLVTSEMPELLALSDRIVVLHRGQVMAQFAHDQASADAVLAAAMGHQ